MSARAPDAYAVIGQPVSHSLSPMIHAQFAAQTDQDITYRAIDVDPKSLAAQLDEFSAAGLCGLNVTLPHKQTARHLCRSVSPRARRAGAVNTMTRRADGWFGDTTDGAGLVRDLAYRGIDITDQSILLFGAGGSAWSVLGDLLDAAPSSVVIANRTLSSAVQLARHYSADERVSAVPLDRVPRRPFRLVLNATSTSLHQIRPALPPGCVRDAHCYDLMYAAGGTVFTEWAFDHGARSTVTGIGMLIEQAALSFEIWRGVCPDTAPVRALLSEKHGFRD